MSFFEPNCHKNQGIKAKQHGGAIVWILIMVALFAALTYALSDGSRSGESQLSDQQAELAAMELMAYGRNIKDTVHRLLINGCEEKEINFANSIQTGIPNNPNAPADKSCNVYDQNGGGISFIRRSKNTNDVSIANNTVITFFLESIVDVGSSAPDIYVFTRPLQYKICEIINQSLGYNFDKSTIPKANLSTNIYTGDIPPATFLIFGDDPEENGIQGLREGCFIDDGCVGSPNSECYSYLKVLIEM